MAVLFATRGRPGVDLLLDHARKAHRNGRLDARTRASSALFVDFEATCAIAMTCRSSCVLKLQIVKIGLHVRDVYLAIALTHDLGPRDYFWWLNCLHLVLLLRVS